MPPAGFEPAISTLKGWCPWPLDDGGNRLGRRTLHAGTTEVYAVDGLPVNTVRGHCPCRRLGWEREGTRRGGRERGLDTWRMQCYRNIVIS